MREAANIAKLPELLTRHQTWGVRLRRGGFVRNVLGYAASLRERDSMMETSKLIYDVGAHTGEDSELYLKKGFSVIAIEAVPEFCDEMHRKFKNYLEAGQLKILNLAISNTSGVVDFYVDEKTSVWGTTDIEWVARNRSLMGESTTRKINVKSSSLGDIIKEH